MVPLDSPSLPAFQLGSAPALDMVPWHAARPHLLANALAEAGRVAPHLMPLAARLLPRMPRRPLASQTIRAITRDRASSPMLLDDAITCPWLAMDAEDARNVLAWDLDHDEALELCEDLARRGSPVPDLMIDPWSGRAHAVLPLRTPVLYREGARVGPQILADLAGRMMAAALRATFLPRRALLKSPWGLVKDLIGTRVLRGPRPAVPVLWDAYQAAATGLMWHTIPGTGAAELRAVIAALADDFGEEAASPEARRHFRKRRPEPSALGRNCALFDLVRFWAYDHVERDGGRILDEALRINAGFFNPLPASEVAATARSIARFMVTRYRPRAVANTDGPNRGRDADTKGADLRSRRAIAGRRSGAQNRADTDARIASAEVRLRAVGGPITLAAIAAEAGISDRTLRRRGLRTNGALSGLAAGAAPGAPQGTPLPESLNFSLSPSPPLPPDPDARLGAVLTALAIVVERVARPGAEAPTVPEVPADLAGHPEVRCLRRLAIDAAADARRRAGARTARAEAASRRADMVARLRADPSAAWAWWRAMVAALDEEWDLREEEAADDPGRLDLVRCRREATMRARWSQWAAARREVAPAQRRGIPDVPDSFDRLIPW